MLDKYPGLCYYNTRKRKEKGIKKMKKTYTLLRAFDSITVTADELLAIMDEELKNGNHVEQVENTEFWGENTYMICYW